MSDSISGAEFWENYVELLPARTVLSLFTADVFGGGDAGKAGANGESVHGFTFLGMVGWNGSDSTAATDPGSHA